LDRIAQIVKKSLKKHNIYDFYALTLISNSPYFRNDSYVKGLCEIVRKEIQYEMYNYDLLMVFGERVKFSVGSSEFKKLKSLNDFWNYLEDIFNGKYEEMIVADGVFSEPWGKVWIAFKKVIQANNWNSFVAAFDHFVDQVHHRGPILEKFPDYIQRAIEIKKHFSDYAEGTSKEVRKLYNQYRRYEKEKDTKEIFIKGSVFESILLSGFKFSKEVIIIIEGGLNLSNAQITELPRLRVSDSLILNNCKNLIKLPVDLQVGGDLSLWNTKITKLPAGLQVVDNLFLNEFITEIPEDAVIGGKVIRKA